MDHVTVGLLTVDLDLCWMSHWHIVTTGICVLEKVLGELF